MTPERYQARTRRLRDRLTEFGQEAAAVSRAANVRYLTGFTGSAGIVAVLAEEAVLFTDFRYRDQAEEEVGRVLPVVIVSRDLWGRVMRFFGEGGVARVALEADHVTAAEVTRFDEDGRVEYTPVAGLVEALRVRKDPDELAAIRRAAEVAERALAAILPEVRPGLREIDVAANLERELRLLGSEWHPFETIVASGPRSALPHARTSNRVIEAGDLLLIDFGARWAGYCSDVTRTYVVGRRADERQRAMYELVREAQARAINGLRAGITGAEADGLARGVIAERGFGDAFGHSLGHGLGLDVHEEPRLSSAVRDPLPVDAVVTVEPGVYFPSWGGVRIEDDVHLTAGGADRLTRGSTELCELL